MVYVKKLRVFENKVPKTILEANGKRQTERKKLKNEET